MKNKLIFYICKHIKVLKNANTSLKIDFILFKMKIIKKLKKLSIY